MELFEVSVQRAFTASHSILLSDGSPEPPHEHDWRMTATFRAAAVDRAMGVVIDFVAVEKAMEAIAAEHSGLLFNSLPAFDDGRCSAERVAQYLAGLIKARLGGREVYRMAVTESPGCTAAYYPNGA